MYELFDTRIWGKLWKIGSVSQSEIKIKLDSLSVFLISYGATFLKYLEKLRFE